jgi:hypothetical protein
MLALGVSILKESSGIWGPGDLEFNLTPAQNTQHLEQLDPRFERNTSIRLDGKGPQSLLRRELGQMIGQP